MTTLAIRAIRFDGKTAVARSVDVHIEGRDLTVVDDEVVLDRTRIDPSRVSERLQRAPRIIALEQGATLEVPDPDGSFDRALEAAGVEPSAVERMQRFWPAALCSLAGVAILAVVAYLHGIPAAANWLAFRFPPGVEQRFGDELMRQLDQRVFDPSTLAADRREAIARRFSEAAAKVAPDVAFRVEYRRMKEEAGVNALALPNGTIVLLDGLVDLANDDDALMGVLAHELGHVAHKHSLRTLLQALGTGAIAAVLWGDFSSVAANVSLTFGVLRYSREFELDADDFAIAFMNQNGIPLDPFADFFTRMEDAVSRKRGASPPEFLSSHPSTEERQRRLREAQVR